MKRIFFFLSLALILSIDIVSEQINHLRAAVGNIAITSIDLQDEVKSLRRSRAPLPKGRSLTHLALDSLIESAIVRYTAEEESIEVTDARVDNEIEREMQLRSLKNVAELKKQLAKFGLTWQEYRKKLAQRILSQQVASETVRPSSPSEKEIRSFYKKNVQKIGLKYKYRIITVSFKQGNLKDELRANQIISQAKKLARTNFPKAAAKYSRHSSKRNGGLIGWQRLDQISQINPRLPALVEQSPVGRVSEEYPLGGTYYIVKVESKRRASLDEIRPKITNILYAQKQQENFKKWLVAERRRLSVKIFLKGYRER